MIGIIGFLVPFMNVIIAQDPASSSPRSTNVTGTNSNILEASTLDLIMQGIDIPIV
jgi:hypothetical protein